MDIESFPSFADGDVRITVLPDIYKLHSSLLRDRSGVLKKILDKSQPLSLTLEQQRQCSASVGYARLNLVGSSIHKYGMLEIQGYDDSHCTMEEIVPSSFPAWPHSIRHVWANMLKIFHGIPPTLDEGGSDLILENCQALVELGEDIQASDAVSRALNTALYSPDQQINRLIAQDPVSWVKLAVYIQSGPIFQESMIHLVGKWGLLEEKDRDSLPIGIRSICNRKLEHLNEIKKAAELKIVNHVPRPRSSTNHYRETNNVYVWMALAYYQQWLCQSFAEGRNYRASDGGAAFYHAIALGGDVYLNKLVQDISHFPTAQTGEESKKGLTELESDLHELKKSINGFVSDLLVNHAKYDPDIFGELPYLTCCQVGEEEMPPRQKNAMASDYAAGVRVTNVNGNFVNPNSLQHTFYQHPRSNNVQEPTGMTNYNGHTDAYYLTNGTQDNFGFNQPNVIPHWSLNWTGAADFSNPAPALPMPSLADMTTGIYQTQMDVNGNFDEIDVFGILPTTETEENDGDMAFI
ncbi:hypothetical protein BJY01DRAFT_146823 [Aspergillus pseudoustus]|uniref:Transcription factor domain-containing protein n=1 Tax=Aspergillus pseudoustus TaxID=1810923 RepID=A0ABR4KAA8_9EURO